MKLIEHGEPIKVDAEKLGWTNQHIYIGNPDSVMEDGVPYIAEVTSTLDWERKVIVTTIKLMAKKQDLICGDCGVNFISHKGMCSSCYVKQL